ncbi:MAG: hypothetical protein WCJ49_05870, partial [Deltaproteobacteria bacterium]
GKTLARIIRKDPSLWVGSKSEIANRLGWVDSPHRAILNYHAMALRCKKIMRNDFRDVVLLGMGGSVITTKVLRDVFFVKNRHIPLHILDTTNPDTIRQTANAIDISKTLFVVATKSGDTVETISLFKYFFTECVKTVGVKKAGTHFVAITDLNTKLVDIAQEDKFADIFISDSDIGGRFSAFSPFGIIPAILIGIDVYEILLRTESYAKTLSTQSKSNMASDAQLLGNCLASYAENGKNKLAIIVPKKLHSIAMWLEQLIAESVGKNGHSIVPILGKEINLQKEFSQDYCFITISPSRNPQIEKTTKMLSNTGHCVIRIKINGLTDIGALMYFWFVVVASIGIDMQINPFNQPDVEIAKKFAQQLKTPKTIATKIDKESVGTVVAKIKSMITKKVNADYIAIITSLVETEQNKKAVDNLCCSLSKVYNKTIIVSTAPQYLHSIGQLYKGDAGNGIFIFLNQKPTCDIEIPCGIKPLNTFAKLLSAQINGDIVALEKLKRSVICFDVSEKRMSGLFGHEICSPL